MKKWEDRKTEEIFSDVALTVKINIEEKILVTGRVAIYNVIRSNF